MIKIYVPMKSLFKITKKKLPVTSIWVTASNYQVAFLPKMDSRMKVFLGIYRNLQLLLRRLPNSNSKNILLNKLPKIVSVTRKQNFGTQTIICIALNSKTAMLIMNWWIPTLRYFLEENLLRFCILWHTMLYQAQSISWH